TYCPSTAKPSTTGRFPMRCFLDVSFCVLALLGSSPSAEDAIFEPGVKLKVEASNGAGGEGPAWDPKLGVLTSGNGHIYQLDRMAECASTARTPGPTVCSSTNGA